MNLLFIADGRSPIAINWIRYFVDAGHAVHLASSYPCAPLPGLASLTVVPLAFGEAAGEMGAASGGKRGLLRRLVPVGARTLARQWLGALTLPRAARRLAALADEIQPDLIHAMRIPYEGMAAALALGGQADPPLLVSVWGNDFTLHARANPWMAALTRRAMQTADALHTDCRRDLRLAQEWGFVAQKPAAALPGNGGVRLEVFYPPVEPAATPLVINPRGMRAYVRNDVFFHAIPLVLARLPEARFLCPTMAGEAQAEKWMQDLGIAQAVTLLPRQSREQMAGLFRSAQVAVSPSVHDGTPNTLLEAMACGCFPVAGDIESLREWITPGVNGALSAPDDPQALAEAIVRALTNPSLRSSAAIFNQKLIAEKAEYGQVMAQAEAFYRRLTKPGQTVQ